MLFAFDIHIHKGNRVTLLCKKMVNKTKTQGVIFAMHLILMTSLLGVCGLLSLFCKRAKREK